MLKGQKKCAAFHGKTRVLFGCELFFGIHILYADMWQHKPDLLSRAECLTGITDFNFQERFKAKCNVQNESELANDF